MRRFFAGLMLSSLFATPASAGTVLITSIVGASYVEQLNKVEATPIVYASIMGASAGAPFGKVNCVPGGFCNSCLTSTTMACSERRVHEGTTMRIYFTVTTDTAGKIFLAYNDGGSIVALTPPQEFRRSVEDDVRNGDAGYIDVDFTVVCGKLTGDANCNTLKTNGTLYVAISADTTIEQSETTPLTIHLFEPQDVTGAGIDTITCTTGQHGVCAFTANPDDEKVYIDDLTPSGNYPNPPDVPILALRVFYTGDQNAPLSSINYASPYVDLGIDATGRALSHYVHGLTNDLYYGFKLATVDKAFNVAYLTDDQQLLSEGCDVNAPIANEVLDAACNYIARPGNVVGLLEDDFNCFISTAAYGSSLAPEVKTFREFRNRFLLSSATGRRLVLAYYKYGPFAARFIHEHEWLKPVARAALWPALLLAKTALWMDSLWQTQD